MESYGVIIYLCDAQIVCCLVSGSPFKLTQCPFDMPSLFVEHFLTFWQCKYISLLSLPCQVISYKISILKPYIYQHTVRSPGWVSQFLCLESHKTEIKCSIWALIIRRLGIIHFQAHSSFDKIQFILGSRRTEVTISFLVVR